MNYQETLDYLYAQLPMFTRVGSSAYKADLTNTLDLCELVDNPQNKFKGIHVGGTNGKGSTSHMLAAVLQTAGYKTGLYTSPHLRDFRERIRINGEMMPQQDIVDFVAIHQANFETIEPSFFEMTVALAFDHFAKNNVDIAIIEVGLGGRLDSTNIITPLVSVITNIGWDHMNLLGDTLPLIAGEKAGIIKPNIPVIIGEYQKIVAPVFEQKAEQQHAPLTFASERWDIEVKEKSEKYLTLTATPKPTTGNRQLITDLQLDLTGSYQLKNVKTVLTAVAELRKQGFNITDTDVQTALKNVQGITGLQGRWQTLSTNPLTICDTGHNPEGIQEVLKNIASVKHNHLHFVIGVVNDKDISKILKMLPQDATYYFCRPDIPRGLDAVSLQSQAVEAGLKGEVYPAVKDALSAAQSAAKEGDLVFVGGSTFVVAEVV
jgi:dihydrofolate synthase/folylpolyglutamate synthase